MKKQVQKIKENKGFSMIELIIVVAIMAILVGIIGAALIPYMEKSRASKDKSALDSVYNAFGSAISESENLADIDNVDASSLPADIKNAIENLLDNGGISGLEAKFGSKQFNGQKIKFFYDKANSTYGVFITGNTNYCDVQIDNSGKEWKVGKGASGKLSDGTTAPGKAAAAPTTPTTP